MTKEEAITMLKNRKMFVKDTQESASVQKKLFELGFAWDDTQKYTKHIYVSYLFTSDNMRITYSNSDETFDASDNIIIKPKEILDIELDDEKSNDNPSYFMSFEEAQEYISKCGFDIPWNDGDVFVDERDITRTVGNVLKWQEDNVISRYTKPINENLNLCEILKDCPEGTEFYTDIYGSVFFKGINSYNEFKQINPYPIIFKKYNGGFFSLTKEGYLLIDYPNCGCVVFPSKDQRDWSKWRYQTPDLPIGTPVVVSPYKDGDWQIKYYAGNKCFFAYGNEKSDKNLKLYFPYIIPFDRFNPNDIEESLKYNICKGDKNDGK